MKYILGFMLFFFIDTATAYTEQDFTILAVGASNNTNSVFIDVEETALSTNCANKTHFKLSVLDQNADRFYSMALVAQTQGKKMRLGYEPGDCLSDAIEPRVFKTTN